jgi:hypothetical protein
MKRIISFAVSIYDTAEEAAVGTLLRKTTDVLEQSKIKMLFDFVFFYIVLLVPLTFVLLLNQDYFHLALGTAFTGIFLISFAILQNKRYYTAAAVITVLNPMLLTMVSSFVNNLDVSPMYAMLWILSILLAFFIIHLRAALMLGLMLCLYLGLVAYIRVNHIEVPVLAGYSQECSDIFNPFLTGCYVLLMIRVLGHHYRNVARLEKLQAREKQKQFSALINQNLTKQFLILKGLSRSGQSEFQDGRTELLDECFAEIERQCDTAINYLDTEKQ